MSLLSARLAGRPVPLTAGIRKPLEAFAPVLALTVVRDVGAGIEVLCAVRRPETNSTHPNVLSVPTRRIDLDVASRWPERAVDGGSVPKLRAAVEELLTRKLGLADPLEFGQIDYDLGPFGAWQGTSYIGYEDGCDVVEDLTMFNLGVRLRAGDRLFPAETAAYSSIHWAPLARFLDVLETRDVTQIDPRLDGILVCVYGLCIETTRHLLEEWAVR
jgi:hypothetical protein